VRHGGASACLIKNITIYSEARQAVAAAVWNPFPPWAL